MKEPQKPICLFAKIGLKYNWFFSLWAKWISVVTLRSNMRHQMERDPTYADHFLERITDRLRLLAEDLRAMNRTFDQASASAHFH